MAASKKPHGKSPARLTSVSIVLHGKNRRAKIPRGKGFPPAAGHTTGLQQAKGLPRLVGLVRQGKTFRQVYEYQNFTGRQRIGMPAPQKNVEPGPLACDPAYALLMQPTVRWGQPPKIDVQRTKRRHARVSGKQGLYRKTAWTNNKTSSDSRSLFIVPAFGRSVKMHIGYRMGISCRRRARRCKKAPSGWTKPRDESIIVENGILYDCGSAAKERLQ